MGFEKEFHKICDKYGCNDRIPSVIKINTGAELPINEFVRLNRNITPESIIINIAKKSSSRISSKAAVTVNQPEKVTNVPCLYVTFDENYVKSLKEIQLNNIPLDVLLAQAIIDVINCHNELQKIYIIKCECAINAFNCISKFISHSKISELYMDSSTVPEINSENILFESCTLEKLSLKRCGVNDSGVKYIGEQLRYEKPAGKTLKYLNLSSNYISDAGAKCIGDLLRSNRYIHTLILSNNLIKDDGCVAIANSLKSFCLTSNEVREKDSRNRDVLKKNQRIFENYVRIKTAGGVHSLSTTATTTNISDCESIEDVETESNFDLNNEILKRRSSVERRCCEILKIDEMIETFSENNEYPWRRSELFTEDKNIFCKGNSNVETLNLAFNYVGRKGICSLIKVIEYQLDDRRLGLKSIILEGDPNLATVYEYQILSRLLRFDAHVDVNDIESKLIGQKISFMPKK